MSGNDIAVGEVRVGRVVSEEESDLPDQAGTMTFDDERGVELHLPYFWEGEDGQNPQYLHAIKWFHRREEPFPPTVMFQDNRGEVTLVDTRVSGVAGATASVGRVRAGTVIFNAPRELKPEYRVQQVRSTIDGLEEFADFRPVTHDIAYADDGTHRTTVTVQANEEVAWKSGEFEFKIKASVSWRAVDGKSFVIEDSRPSLLTISADGATPLEHVRAQWGVRALLSLMFGAATPWRSHHVFDNEFPRWGMGAIDHGPHDVRTLLSGTVRQHSAPVPDRMPQAVFRLRQVGAESMRTWLGHYGDPRFERAVQPAVEVFNGLSAFTEPQLMMLAVSLERFGFYSFGDGQRRGMHELIERCLQESGFDWSQVGSIPAIANAITHVNNDLKHGDRKTYPDADVLIGITHLAKIIVRAQLFTVLDLDEDARTTFINSNDARYALAYFGRAGLSLNEDGTFTRVTPEPEH